MNINKIKAAFCAVMLSAAVCAHGQAIISHTATIADYGGCHVDKVDFPEGKEYYEVWLRNGDKIVTNVFMRLATRQEVIARLSYLYNFDKGDGYLIDLQTLTGNTALSDGSNKFIIGGDGQIGKIVVYKITLGKLLNALGQSARPTSDDGTKKKQSSGDDLYSGVSVY